MRAQVVLTPAESKRLIAKGVVKMNVVQEAFNKGIIVISVGTTCLCILEELLKQQLSPIENYLSGVILPERTCSLTSTRQDIVSRGYAPFWAFEEGKIISDVSLRDLLSRMSSSDVFIKGANAIDPNRRAGVLLGSPNGGTIGIAMPAIIARGINLIIPVGLEKMIPTSIEIASKEAGIQRMNYSTGLPVGLMPMPGMVITEIEAITLLTGAQAIPIAAGGISGAEGSNLLVIKGTDRQVKQAIKIIETIRGEKSPQISPPNCTQCKILICPYGKKQKLKKKKKI
jgi:hypothetical protein